MKPAILYGAASLLSVSIGLGAYYIVSQRGADQFAQCRTSSVAGNSQIGGPFSLIDHTGTRVSEQDVIDGLTLIYFGYTFCPDVCPLDTARNAEAVEILEEDGIMVKPVMVSVDPERDTAEVMADFVSYIHPRMVGLTGSAEEIKAVAKEYKIFYGAEEHEPDDEYYLVSHSTNAYLMAPDYGLLQFFTRADRPEAMAKTIACYAEAI